MTKHYIQPSSNIQTTIGSFAICVGSVHGNANLEYGGGSDGSNDDQKPF